MPRADVRYRGLDHRRKRHRARRALCQFETLQPIILSVPRAEFSCDPPTRRYFVSQHVVIAIFLSQHHGNVAGQPWRSSFLWIHGDVVTYGAVVHEADEEIDAGRSQLPPAEPWTN